MSRDEIIETLRRAYPDLQKRYGLSSLGVFGSVARGEDEPGSDVDIFATFRPDIRVSLNTLAELANDLEAVLGRDVDLTLDEPALRPRFRKSLERDFICVA